MRRRGLPDEVSPDDLRKNAGPLSGPRFALFVEDG